jgi:hypothetical protein
VDKVVLLVSVIAIFPLSAGLMASDSPAFQAFVSALALPFVLMFPYALRWHGENRIVLDRERLTVYRGPFGTELPAFRTDEIGAIRVNHRTTNSSLTLVSDERLLRILAPPSVARWIRRRLTLHLRDLGRERAGETEAGVEPR